MRLIRALMTMLMFTPAAAYAQKPQEAAESANEQLTLAASIAHWAERNDDANALLIAADVVGPTRMLVLDDVGSVDGEPAMAFSRAALLARARELARGDQTLLGRIDALAAETGRGVLGQPPLAARLRLQPGQVRVLSFTAAGGELLSVMLSRDGDSPIIMELRDAAGNSLCRAQSLSGDSWCRGLRPSSDARFELRLFNSGRVPSEIVIATN